MTTKKIEFNAIEEIATKDFALECCEMSEKFSFFRRFLVGGFFSILLLMVGFFSQYAITHFHSATITLDSTNEYQYFVAPKSLVFIFFSILFFTLVFGGTFYRKRCNIKLSLFSAKWLMAITIFLYTLSFIVSQLLVSVKILRYFYSALFIISIFLIIFNTKKNIHELLYGETKEDDFISKNWKKIRELIGILFSIAVIYSILFQNNNTLKQNFYLILLWFFPLLIIAAGFFWTSIYKSYIKLFYLNYFSEDFRKKFSVDNRVWYGSKSKEFKEEQKNNATFLNT